MEGGANSPNQHWWIAKLFNQSKLEEEIPNWICIDTLLVQEYKKQGNTTSSVNTAVGSGFSLQLQGSRFDLELRLLRVHVRLVTIRVYTRFSSFRALVTPSVPGIGLGSTMVRTRIKRLMMMHEWTVSFVNQTSINSMEMSDCFWKLFTLNIFVDNR